MPIDQKALAAAQRDGQPVELDNPNARTRWLDARRVDAKGAMLTGVLARASSTRRRMEAESLRFRAQRGGVGFLGPAPPAPPGASGSVNWTPLGPSVVAHGQASNHPPVSGRVNGIAVGPGGLRAYVGAANGGAWFTDNSGQTWSPLDDYAMSPSFGTGLEADSLSVGAIAVAFGATASNDTVYVGTGEPGAGDGYAGVGIKSSTNGGGSFTLEATNLGGANIYRIAIDPDDATKAFAATTRGLYARPASSPFTAWNQVVSPAFASAGGTVTDVIVVGSGASKTFYAVFQNDSVYSSPDGATWSAVTGVPAGPFPGDRIVLAAGENHPEVVYALTSSGTLCRLDSGTGGAFQTVSGVPQALFFNGQGSYDIALGVDPGNSDTVYLVGDLTWDSVPGNADWSLSFYKGTITGAPGSYAFPFNAANDVFIDGSGLRNSSNVPNDPTWIGRGVHADGHSFAFATNADGTHDRTIVWVGSDGGVFASMASGAISSFVAINDGLAITEITYFGQRVDTDAVFLAGAQDQGTFRFRGEQVAYESPVGDGGGVVVDPNNPYNMMRQYVGWDLWTTTDGDTSGTWTDLPTAGLFPPVGLAPTAAQQAAVTAEGYFQFPNPQTAFYSQIGVSPAGVSPTLVTFGTNRLWLSSDWGATWVTLPTASNPYAGGAVNAVQDVLDNTPVVASAIASSSLIFAATSGGIWQYTLAGATWTKTRIDTAPLPAFRVITALAVENAAAGTLYATLGGGGVEHVWFYDGTWHATGLLATVDIPAHAIVVDPDHTNNVYAGTDVGVWKGVRSGTTWTWSPFSNGLPESAVLWLAIHERTRLLRAGTHGRGMWEITLDAPSNPDPDIYLRVNYADTGRIVGGSRYPWVDNAPDPTAQGYNVFHWMSADIKVRRPNLANPPLSPQQDYFDFAVNIGDYIDSMTHMETADLPGTNDTYFVEVHNRGTTTLPGSNVQVLLLLTDASTALPALPANYATHIAAADTSAAWLGPNWHFADPSNPYRTLPGRLSARIPQVAVYNNVDLTALALPAGHDHVCAAAFITTPLDPLISTETSLDVLTMQDKHVAHRNLHLVAATATPAPPPGGPGGAPFVHTPKTFFVDFNNVTKERALFDIAFERIEPLGHVSVVLPRSHAADVQAQGFGVRTGAELEPAHRSHFDGFFRMLHAGLERLDAVLPGAGGGGNDDEGDDDAPRRRTARADGARERWNDRITALDHERVFVAEQGAATTLRQVAIPAQSRITAAVTVHAPAHAKPGDTYRFDIVQRRAGKIVGGSSYVLAVMQSPAEPE